MKLKQDGGNPVWLVQDLLQAYVMHVSKIDDLRQNHQQHVPHELVWEPECEDSCATFTLATDQLPDDLQSKISIQAQQQFSQNNLL